MIEFCLEKALAGNKVITRDGREVTELHNFFGNANNTIFGVIDDGVDSWVDNGSYHNVVSECGADLFMAPKKLSGFVNVYYDDDSLYMIHVDRRTTDKMAGKLRTACIDLSQFEEGHGL